MTYLHDTHPKKGAERWTGSFGRRHPAMGKRWRTKGSAGPVEVRQMTVDECVELAERECAEPPCPCVAECDREQCCLKNEYEASLEPGRGGPW